MRRAVTLVGIVVAVSTAAALAPSVGFAADPAPVQQAAAPRPASTFQSLRVGATGPRVEQVQSALRSLGYSLAVDGRFGPITLLRVREFQAARGLQVDGIVGPVTWRALGLDAGAAPATPAAPSAGASEHLRRGATGPRVEQVQSALRSLGYGLAVDGRFGPITQQRVREFQAARGLQVDGIVGPVTWRALGLDGSTPSSTPTAPASPAPPPASTGGYQHPDSDVERWHDDALAAGWAESDWRTLSCIIQRESGGVPTASNSSSAMGLLQIMWSVHGSWIGGSSNQLLDGPTNLRLGRELYVRAGGWGPWGSTTSPC